MARNDDSDLYTGVMYTDAFNNVPVDLDAKREQEHEDDDNRKLTPYAELTDSIVEDEIAAISDIRSYLEQGIKTEADIQAEYRARELYIAFLNKFRGTVEVRVESVRQKDEE